MRLRNSEIRIENTNICTASCTICPRNKMTRQMTTMPLSHFKYLVEQGKEMGAETVSIFGYGEPLTDMGLEEKIQYCTDLGIKTFVTTNASLLGEERAKSILDAGLGHIRFSVHGVGEEYEKVHRKLKWPVVYGNILRFLSMDHDGCKVSVIVIPMNGEKVEDIRQFWEYGTDYLEIWRPHNWAGAKAYRQVIPKHRTCGRPFSGPVQINADGKMMVCCFDFNGRLTVGDTYAEPIADILTGDKFQEIRRKHTDGDLSGLVCKTCDQLNIEEESPLLYSNREMGINKTSSTKYQLRSE